MFTNLRRSHNFLTDFFVDTQKLKKKDKKRFLFIFQAIKSSCNSFSLQNCFLLLFIDISQELDEFYVKEIDKFD